MLWMGNRFLRLTGVDPCISFCDFWQKENPTGVNFTMLQSFTFSNPNEKGIFLYRKGVGLIVGWLGHTRKRNVVFNIGVYMSNFNFIWFWADHNWHKQNCQNGKHCDFCHFSWICHSLLHHRGMLLHFCESDLLHLAFMKVRRTQVELTNLSSLRVTDSLINSA